MKREDVIRLAKEAGFRDDLGEGWLYCGSPWDPEPEMPVLERFASLVAAKEREENANLCDERAYGICGATAKNCAAAIRAIGDQQ